ncbi:hypothetical protein MFLAVUS_003921 [Mucor flavus]|uniref:Uncharacterized protein n=1 Tax=Mucor flavus TaxID=439312 RepID=A0ABP9YUG9_9FUNG
MFIYRTENRSQSEDLFKNVIRECANTKGNESFQKAATKISTRPRSQKKTLQVIEEINKTDSGSSYIDSSSDDESVEHCTDYLTGPGVTDYDMNIIELPDFTPFIVHNINILKLFLILRTSWKSVIESLESDYEKKIVLNLHCLVDCVRLLSKQQVPTDTFSVNNLDKGSLKKFTLESLLNNECHVVVGGSSSTLSTNSKARKRFDPTLQGKKADCAASIVVEGSKKSLVIDETKFMKNNVEFTCRYGSMLFNLTKDSADGLQEYMLGNRILDIPLEGTKIDLYSLDLRYKSLL